MLSGAGVGRNSNAQLRSVDAVGHCPSIANRSPAPLSFFRRHVVQLSAQTARACLHSCAASDAQGLGFAFLLSVVVARSSHELALQTACWRLAPVAATQPAFFVPDTKLQGGGL